MADEKKTKEQLVERVLQLTRDLREAEGAKKRDTKLHGEHIAEIKAQIAEAMDAHDKA